ncbi:ATPase synthesis protein 25 mitochondrial [Podospora pseudocomata]|uniref:ATPase synthesis protein 25 n=1 Tax=Podospora pseudocomata TaxID=2093779 RepID=A0ABR0G998_9PEZI|nr:ATPase synthesis protein 25 mitochondrial [Podospora pseudocomata]
MVNRKREKSSAAIRDDRLKLITPTAKILPTSPNAGAVSGDELCRDQSDVRQDFPEGETELVFNGHGLLLKTSPTISTSTSRLIQLQNKTIMAGPSVTGAIRCSSCTRSVFRSLIGSIAESRTPQAALRSQRLVTPAVGSRYHSSFRASPPLRGGPALEETLQREELDGSISSSNLDSNNATTTTTTTTTSSEPSDVPWYLQVEPPRHPTLMHEPPPLPDIPEDSPKVMEPLLKYISEELGMDDLSLVDLRDRDPPAAIGQDVIMIVGTARSERHLHVSADRLVRWLRGRGIGADADGLLGRNELKIKLRRIARKAKMLGTARSARAGDDGITTGWICVNLGNVGGSRREVQMVDEEGRSMGFGVPPTGASVIVQMLTESRRQELDLENLWEEMGREAVETYERPPPLRRDFSGYKAYAGRRTRSEGYRPRRIREFSTAAVPQGTIGALAVKAFRNGRG